MSSAGELGRAVQSLPSGFLMPPATRPPLSDPLKGGPVIAPPPQPRPDAPGTPMGGFGVGAIQPQARFQPMTGADAFLGSGPTQFGANRFLQGPGFTQADLTTPPAHFLPGNIMNPEINRLLARQGAGAATGGRRPIRGLLNIA